MRALCFTSHCPALTVVDQIERTLVIRILRGAYPPDTNLPPVRALAAEFETTIPTIQRTVARIEALGLIVARRGSGLRVLDPVIHSNVNVLPYWFDALRDQPDRSARMLGQVLKIRRHLAAELVSELPAPSPELVEALRDAMLAKGIEEQRDTDLHFTRSVLASTNNFAVSMLFNTVEHIILNVRGVAEAFYGDEDLHKRTLAEVVAAAAGSGPEAAARLDRAFELWDASAVRIYREWLIEHADEFGPFV